MPSSRPHLAQRFERIAASALILGAIILAGWLWLRDHPQHNPWAPLDLNDPPGWATATKIAQLKDDPANCLQVLERSQVAHVAPPPMGEGVCLRDDNVRLSVAPLVPSSPAMSCSAASGFKIWMDQVVQPAAQSILGSPVATIRHMGTYNCRRLYGRSAGAWSEHATANAIDIGGFTLQNGERVSLLADWNGNDEKARFLRKVRDGACATFSTVLSPEYNAAHRDHFHLDQAARAWGVCR